MIKTSVPKASHCFILLFLALFPLSDFGQAQPEDGVVDGKGRTLVIPVTDSEDYMVDEVQAEFILDALDMAEAANYDRVVITIDTYGGMLMPAREISNRLLRMNIPTIAYVETKAISAGVFIAWACDVIIMEEATTMGDAQMVYPTIEGGIQEAPEKQLTVYRSDWRKSSDLKKRSPAVAQAFYDKDVELLQIGTENDFDFILRKDYDKLDEADRKPILSVVSEKGKLLTFHAEEAEALGLVTIAKNFDEFIESMNINPNQVDRFDMSTNQKILRFIGNNSWLFLILTLVGLNGIYMELKAPGFGIPGLTAIVCFTIVFGSRFFLGTATPLEMVLFVMGIMLCVIEIFILPGFGIPGIAGIVCMLGALVLASLPDFNVPAMTVPWDWIRDTTSLVLAAFIGSLCTMLFVFPAVMKIPAARRNMLPNEQLVEDGYVGASIGDPEVLLGQTGRVEGCLRPLGKIRLENGKLLEVSSIAGYQDDGALMRVVQVDGNLVSVRPIDDHESAVQV